MILRPAGDHRRGEKPRLTSMLRRKIHKCALSLWILYHLYELIAGPANLRRLKSSPKTDLQMM